MKIRGLAGRAFLAHDQHAPCTLRTLSSKGKGEGRVGGLVDFRFFFFSLSLLEQGNIIVGEKAGGLQIFRIVSGSMLVSSKGRRRLFKTRETKSGLIRLTSVSYATLRRAGAGELLESRNEIRLAD